MVEIGPSVSEEKIKMSIYKNQRLQEPVIAHLAYSTILKEDNLKTVSPKFGLIELVVLERFFNEFPKWSNVKLSSTVAAILVGRRGHWIQF